MLYNFKNFDWRQQYGGVRGRVLWEELLEEVKLHITPLCFYWIHF